MLQLVFERFQDMRYNSLDTEISDLRSSSSSLGYKTSSGCTRSITDLQSPQFHRLYDFSAKAPHKQGKPSRPPGTQESQKLLSPLTSRMRYNQDSRERDI